MSGYHQFYEGADYGFDPAGPSGPMYNNFSGYSNVNIRDIGFTHDPRTSNLLKSTSEKLNTGASTIEVQGISMDQLDYVPDQQWDELNRLRKLTGVDFTFHGPLVEATGVTKQGWDETQRQHAEEEMYSAIERAQRMDPKGNMVVTFHSSNGLPDPEVVQKMPDGKEVVTSMMVVDSRTGQFANIGPPTKDFFKHGKDALPDVIKDKLKEQNSEAWNRQLQGATMHANNGYTTIQRALNEDENTEYENRLRKGARQGRINFFKQSVKDPEAANAFLQSCSPEEQRYLMRGRDELTQGSVYLRDAYNDLQRLYNQAYEAAQDQGDKKTIKILDKYQERAAKEIQTVANDPSRITEFGRLVMDGINTLSTIEEAPQTQMPLRDWAIDKASDTFANVAYRGYEKFEGSAPIISIENPPAGSGLHKGADLRDLVDKSRDKFIKRAMSEKNMSYKKAKEQADKLLGVTWDVGHINMIRKFGYDEKDTVKETEKVADMVKHVHLSDNFGLSHTELPMGMGNVPTKDHMELIDKFNTQKRKIKKIVETGGWYQHFQVTPFRETMEAFGSPLYAMHMAPQWQAAAGANPYFAGRGLNPDIHHSLYGAGFTTLPIELGGQVQGGVNRMSGTSLS